MGYIFVTILLLFIIVCCGLAYLEYCKHDWKEIKHYETESEFEMISRQHLRPKTFSKTHKKYITIFQCTKCKKLKKIIVTND